MKCSGSYSVLKSEVRAFPRYIIKIKVYRIPLCPQQSMCVLTLFILAGVCRFIQTKKKDSCCDKSERKKNNQKQLTHHRAPILTYSMRQHIK